MNELTPKLTKQEKKELDAAVATVRTWIDSAVKVGEALEQIRDRRLYRETHGSFEAFAKEVLGLSKPRAYQILEETKVRKNLPGTVDMSSRGVREVGKVPMEHRETIVKKAQENAAQSGRRTVNAQDVRVAAEQTSIPIGATAAPKKEKVMPVDAKPTEYYEDDVGNEVPESLYPIWRCKARILEICERVRSSSIHKDLDDLKALGVIMNSPAMEEVARNIKDMVQEASKRIHDLQPSIVNGSYWYSIAESVGDQSENG